MHKWNKPTEWGRRKWSKIRISRSYYCTEHAVRHVCMWLHFKWTKMPDSYLHNGVKQKWSFQVRYVLRSMWDERDKGSGNSFHFNHSERRVESLSSALCQLFMLVPPTWLPHFTLLSIYFLNNLVSSVCVQRRRGHNQSSSK